MKRAPGALLGAALAVAGLLLLAGSPTSAAHYVPQAGDSFSYTETVVLDNGVGNYTGYSEDSFYNGSIQVTGVLPNGTESASYQSAGTYNNNLGQSSPWSESGTFTFSATTFHYVQGTDNQTGYVNPFVWFYVNSSLRAGNAVTILNTPSTIVSTNVSFATPVSASGYARTMFLEGNGSYQRNDVYGVFTASYNWKAYYDPTTGYALGYVYTETDSDGAGDGFTLVDSATDTHTSFPVIQGVAPPSSGGSGSSALPSWVLPAVVVIVVLILVVVVVVVVTRRGGRGRELPRHSVPASAPIYAPPPPVGLIPGGQPTPQVVMRETVKVACQYCGTLMDSTATVCPKCGAPRT